MPHSAIENDLLLDLERIVVASVAVTARALADVAPELTFVQWRVLVLVDQPGGRTVGSVAEALGAKIAGISRLIGRLRARGLVERRRGDDDGRLVHVSLTEAGADLRNRVIERRRAELRSAISDARLADDTTTALHRLAAVLELMT